MSKIAILGCGWLGYPLAISLLKKGHSITGTTTSVLKLENLKDVGIDGHLWSIDDLSGIHFLDGIDVLILNIPPSKTNSSYSTLLEKFILTIKDTIHVLFISTTSVYPDSIELAEESYQFTETDLLKETVQAELKISKILTSRLTILRFAGLIGESRHPVKYLAGKEEIPNGKSSVNLIHLNDCIQIIEKIIKENNWGTILNGCNPEHPTREEYYQKCAQFYKLDIPKFKDQGEKSKVVSTQKLIDELSFSYGSSIYEI